MEMISHPIANCEKAWELYYEWVPIAALFKKGRKQYESACLRYKWHIAKCPVCREGLDANA